MVTNETVQISAASLYKAAPILVPTYGVALSLIYLQFYWGWFDINVFSYLSAADIALAAMYGLLPLVGALMVGIASGFSAGAQQGASLMRLTDYLYLALLLGIMALLVYYERPMIGLCGAFLLLALIFKPLAIRIRGFATSAAARLVVFVALCTPVIVAGSAITSALFISFGESSARVSLSGPVLMTAADSEVHHLGHVGDYDFFYIPQSKSVLRIQSTLIEQMQFVGRGSKTPAAAATVHSGTGHSPSPDGG